MVPAAERLHQVFAVVERHVEDRWGIPVLVKDVPSPFTGDLDGAEIHVDYDLPVDEAVFIIAHLFGHTVQWNVSPAARELGMARPERWTDELLARLHDYERQAAGYSLQLFHDCQVRDLDPWLSDFAACDFAYLDHFYRTGDKRPFRSFWRDGAELLVPLSIPDFQPTRWVSRWGGIVV